MNDNREFGRRAFLGAIGAGVGVALARPSVLPSVGSSWLGGLHPDMSMADLLRIFEASLTPIQRQHTLLPSDHPVRQITNTVAVHRGPHIGTLFNAEQIALIREMYRLMLSSQGRSWFKNTTSLEGKFEGASLKIYCADGSRIAEGSLSNSQVVINGGHFMLRSSGQSDDKRSHLNNAYAFGGPIAYGQQLGNNRFKVEGNAFKAHGDAVNAVHLEMDESERARAYLRSPPSELLTQIQGEQATLPGIKIGSAREPVQARARQAIDTLFAAYSEQQRDAWSAIDENGGLESLHLSLYEEFAFYQDGAVYADLSAEQRAERGLPYFQVWRIEGPACVIHFHGYPHVHAYINVVRDPQRIAIGEVLTETARAFDQASTRALLNAALKHQTGEPVSYYPERVLGRLSPGAVSTGSLFALEPFDNAIIIANIRSERMSASVQTSLIAQGVVIKPEQVTRVATVDYMLKRPDLFGLPESVEETGLAMRTALVDAVRERDLASLLADA